MSNFKIAINEVLDRMKAATGITRESFAERIGMNNSTLHNYMAGRAVSSPQALAQIASGLEEKDAFVVIRARLQDDIPDEWKDRILIDLQKGHRERLQISGFDMLPAKFRRQVEALLEEAKGNEHIIGFIDEFAALLGLDTADPAPSALADVLCPALEKIPAMDAPGAVFAKASPPKSRESSSTHSLNEDPPETKLTKTRAVMRRVASKTPPQK